MANESVDKVKKKRVKTSQFYASNKLCLLE